jgi:glycosyltransferase involved in cell wall biosynthesis
MSDTSSGRGRVVAIMPARNSAKTLEDTFRAIPQGCIDQVILVDNASKDDTVAIAERLGITVVRHDVDRGFGGSMKSLMRTAFAADADYLVELHPDNQYDPRGIPALLEKMGQHRYAMVIGSRFLPPGRALEGGMPRWRFAANRILTVCNNLMLGVRMSEFHSGFRVYSGTWARTVPLDQMSDDFILGFQFISHAVTHGWQIGEIPGTCRYFDEASSNPLRGSVIYGWGTLTESFKAMLYRLGLTAACAAMACHW